MATWSLLAHTLTAGGQPQQFFTESSRWGGGEEVFLIAALRVGGPSDDVMPRRAVGMGRDRASARRSLEDTLSRYDPTYHILPSR